MTSKSKKEFNPREFFFNEKAYPSKRLGQNFIKDLRVIERIVETAELSEEDRVIEIGPGLGALTFALAGKAGKVIAIEKDKRLVSRLSGLCSEYRNVELIPGDGLKIDFRDFYRGRKMKVISNLPYSISSPVLFKLLEDRDIFSCFILMLQREVGERITAKPGGKLYGSISVLLQTYMDVNLEFRVSPSAFWPKPKVDSVVLKLIPLPAPRVPVSDDKLYEKVVRAAFSSRRKMLGNSLRSILSKEIVESVLQSSGIDKSRRAETLSVEEFGALTEEVIKFDSPY
ncbi:MAG: 16S rRNA (adenine(1518)-N(6)/adenine(1519)-N(6))-dimethyltransferase RsmA [Deltaproteobacteria bacterium]